MLTLSQLEARELAGKQWRLNGSTYTFANYDRNAPGQPPWKSGAEGIAYPLLNGDGTPKAYAKFFDALKMTPKRVRRTQWLVGQQLDGWASELRGAPRNWIDTRSDGAPDGVGFNFTCSFADAVPGRTWLELKVDVIDGVVQLSDDLRRRCVENLLRGLVFLERNGIVHGDLSPNNVIVDVEASPDRPALYLIDFDGFVAPQAGELAGLSADEGGTFGTDGYCPPRLMQLAQRDPSQATPFSDGYARDMLLLELLCFDSDCDFEAPPIRWDHALVVSRVANSVLGRRMQHLQSDDVFQQAEERRPSSHDLARAVGLPTPPRIKQPRPTRQRPVELGNAPNNHLPGSVETWLRGGIDLLWLLCVVHVALVAFWFTGWLLGDGSVHTMTPIGTRLLLGARLFLTAGAFLGGLAGLSMLAFAERHARLINVVGFWFWLPARRIVDRSDLTHLWLAACKLAAILAALSASALLLVRP